ncbi:MAG: DUF1648 domain-containing protein, partial [Gemmatimonadetes bacterium]|nr:DUF1648 domain-containing protein [Gemmatimonadota bacterium]
MKVTHVINGLLLAALIIGSAVVWQQLPENIPVHFGASGRADRWATTS